MMMSNAQEDGGWWWQLTFHHEWWMAFRSFYFWRIMISWSHDLMISWWNYFCYYLTRKRAYCQLNLSTVIILCNQCHGRNIIERKAGSSGTRVGDTFVPTSSGNRLAHRIRHNLVPNFDFLLLSYPLKIIYCLCRCYQIKSQTLCQEG